MNSLPNVLVSHEVCFLECQYIGALLRNTTKPVLDLLVKLSPALSASKNTLIVNPRPRGSGIFGGKLRQVELENGQACWAFGSTQYVQAAVNNVVEYLSKRNKGLAARAANPLSDGYRPEIDISPELGPEDASYYHSLILVYFDG